MWDAILDVLRRKAMQGVDVRVMYDDFGCITRLPMRYCKKLREMGIQAHVFNPFIPVLSGRLNNRDHRKLMIIDGKVGFTGGSISRTNTSTKSSASGTGRTAAFWSAARRSGRWS